MAWFREAHFRWPQKVRFNEDKEGTHCFQEEARTWTQVPEEPGEGWLQGQEGHVQAFQALKASETRDPRPETQDIQKVY